LFGHCIIPRPQGPILVKTGTASSVLFKNVFTTQATFSYSIDNPAFTIKASDTIESKKVCNMTINFKPGNNSNQNNQNSSNSQNSNSKNSNNNNNNNNNNSTNTSRVTTPSKIGKLTITHHSGVSWVYYLKGMT